MDLWQTEYFSFCVKQSDNSERWLKLQNSLTQERIGENSHLIFKLKYLKQAKKMIDPAAIHLYYLQIHHNIVRGYWPVTEQLAIRLAAYQLQILYGNFNSEKHKVGFFDDDTVRSFLPPAIIQSSPLPYLQRRIFGIYSKLKESFLKKTDAEMRYSEIAKRIPLYGATVFDVMENGPRKLGIVEDGFFISKLQKEPQPQSPNSNNNSPASPSMNKEGGLLDLQYDFYQFLEIGGWNQTASGVQIRISNPDKVSIYSNLSLLSIPFHSIPSNI